MAYQLPLSPFSMERVAPITRPTFALCGTFSGNIPAARWLRRLEYELQSCQRVGSEIPPKQYLHYIDILLVDEAAKWAESTSEIIGLLETEEPTESTLHHFLSLFKDRFPTAAVVDTPPRWFPDELDDLRQNDDTLLAYYQRTVQLMHRFGFRDSLATPLARHEESGLDLIVSAFIRGLSDPATKVGALQHSSTRKSLHNAFLGAQETYQSRVIIQKIQYEETRTKEAAFYKEVVHRNVSEAQIESMLAQHNAGKPVSEPVPTRPLLPPPPKKEDRHVSFSVPVSEPRFPEPPNASAAVVDSKSISYGTAGLGPRFEPPPGVRILQRGQEDHEDRGFGGGLAYSLGAHAVGFGPMDHG